jgi:hypothetical protein
MARIIVAADGFEKLTLSVCADSSREWRRECSITGMMLILEAIVGAYAVGFTAMLVLMRRAPEGYEDEQGFHIRWKNNAPEIRDVACVWVTCAV